MTCPFYSHTFISNPEQVCSLSFSVTWLSPQISVVFFSQLHCFDSGIFSTLAFADCPSTSEAIHMAGTDISSASLNGVFFYSKKIRNKFKEIFKCSMPWDQIWNCCDNLQIFVMKLSTIIYFKKKKSFFHHNTDVLVSYNTSAVPEEQSDITW